MHREIWWRNGRGVARAGLVMREFDRPPVLPGISYVEIEYRPWTQTRILCDVDPLHWRQMYPSEWAICEGLLDRMEREAALWFSGSC